MPTNRAPHMLQLRARHSVAAVVLSAVSTSCGSSPEAVANGDDPMAALTVSAPSTRYNAGFWREQARADERGLWARALAYCGEPRPRPGLEADGAKPNCNEVRVAAFQLRNERSMQEVRARVEARAARERAMTPQERQAEFEKNLWKP